MHSDDIAKEINSRLVTEQKPTINKRTIVNAMSKNPERFQTVGKSGRWGLAEWEFVKSSIVQLMVEGFYKLKRPAKAHEIYEYVKLIRSDVNPKSITTYLHDRPEFVQVGWGLYQLSEWKISDEQKKRIKQIKKPWGLEKYAQTVIEIYKQRATREIPLKELIEELTKVSGRSTRTIENIVLRKLPMIRIEVIDNLPHKKAVLVSDQDFQRQPRVTLRDKIPQAIREVLTKSPGHSMRVMELRNKVMKMTKCHEKTFYRYLDDMEDIKKQVLPDGMLTAQLITTSTRNGRITATKEFDYDVAISYAGQDYEYALELFKHLTKAGLEVFFAPHHQFILAADYLPDILTSIYSEKSRKCVILFSEHYNRSDYTKGERRAAYDRKFFVDPNYIFLIRLDDTEPAWGLKGDIYYHINTVQLHEIAHLIIDTIKGVESADTTGK